MIFWVQSGGGGWGLDRFREPLLFIPPPVYLYAWDLIPWHLWTLAQWGRVYSTSSLVSNSKTKYISVLGIVHYYLSYLYNLVATIHTVGYCAEPLDKAVEDYSYLCFTYIFLTHNGTRDAAWLLSASFFWWTLRFSGRRRRECKMMRRSSSGMTYIYTCITINEQTIDISSKRVDSLPNQIKNKVYFKIFAKCWRRRWLTVRAAVLSLLARLPAVLASILEIGCGKSRFSLVSCGNSTCRATRCQVQVV